jgi:hypothetical protein
MLDRMARSSFLMLKPCNAQAILCNVRSTAAVLTRLATGVIITVFGGLLVLGGLGPAGASGATDPSGNGVGIYPTNVSFTKALRGGEYLQTIGVINGSSAPRVFRFSLQGPLAPWLAVVYPSDPSVRLSTVTAPPGTTTVQLRLEVPPHTAEGAYTGALNVVGQPLKGSYSKGASPVSVGVQIKVNAQVTGTQVIAGALIDVRSYPAIEVGDPLTVFSLIRNLSNVILAPVFRLKITRGAALVYDKTSTGEWMIPGSLSTLQVDWPGADTRSQVLGTYQAQLNVSFPGLSLGTRELNFQLDPYGYLHRSGRLLALELLNHPKVGSAAYVGASLVNTGAVQADSTFVGQLYRNGVLLRGVTSYQVLLAPGGRGIATLIVALSQGGLYRVTGVGNFAGAQSNSLSLSFRLSSPPFPILYPIAGGAAIVLLALALMWRISRRSRRSKRFRRTTRYDNYGAPRQLRAHSPGGAHARGGAHGRRAHARGEPSPSGQVRGP